MSKDNHYDGILAEELRDQFRLILEALTALKDVPADIKRIKESVVDLEEWRELAKLVIRDQNKTLNNHEIRLGNLEAA
ncbi:MAG: hypothetical protein JWL89_233 [Candidatus Saccharibacteria bacterium]|nr:hypothetical protein [Candidatus Saccharibacteria bacterium]